jgi:hypothetical protein
VETAKTTAAISTGSFPVLCIWPTAYWGEAAEAGQFDNREIVL